MFLENLFVVIGAIIILFMLWVVVGVRHFKYLKEELNDQWELVDETLRKRYDYITNLIETIRKFSNSEEGLIERVIQSRQKVVKESSKGIDRITLEHEFTGDINDLIDLSTRLPELARDTNYLELRKEIDDLEKTILERANKYNEMVRYYNKHREAAFLKPITVLGRFDVGTVFEFEK